MKKLLASLASGRCYHSDSDSDDQPGTMWTRRTDWRTRWRRRSRRETEEGTCDSVARDGRRRLSTASSASTAASTCRAARRGPRPPNWVRDCSRPEHFVLRAGKFVPEDR